ncbi:Uncharacterised protein [Mycobacteroides abscessus subsp. abscessus]|nr:Uncharacterised protein [Mycobacteroides abscessus subsp. abscessus]
MTSSLFSLEIGSGLPVCTLWAYASVSVGNVFGASGTRT